METSAGAWRNWPASPWYFRNSACSQISSGLANRMPGQQQQVRLAAPIITPAGTCASQSTTEPSMLEQQRFESADHRGQHGQADDHAQAARGGPDKRETPAAAVAAGRQGRVDAVFGNQWNKAGFLCFVRAVCQGARIVLLLILLGTAALRRAGLTGQAAFLYAACIAAQPARRGRINRRKQCRKWIAALLLAMSLAHAADTAPKLGSDEQKAAYAPGYRMGPACSAMRRIWDGNRQERHERRFLASRRRH